MSPRPKRATIRQLAEKTGLSPAAVSYALRGIQVSAETQVRVQEAAAEMGYEADPIARALRGGATGMVALLVGSLSDFFTQELSRAVQRELRAADRHTLVADADGTPGLELELARRLVDQRVDGIIVSPIGPPSGDWAAIAERVPWSPSATRCPACRRPARSCSTTTAASRTPCATCTSSAIAGSRCCRGRPRRRRAAAPSAPSSGPRARSASSARSCRARTR